LNGIGVSIFCSVLIQYSQFQLFIPGQTVYWIATTGVSLVGKSINDFFDRYMVGNCG